MQIQKHILIWMIGLSAMILPQIQAFSNADSLVLVSLYNQTDGPNWTNNANWLVQNMPIGSWHGITTDAGGKVIKIELIGNKLNGQVPGSINQLDQLTVLNINDNSINNLPAFSTVSLDNLNAIECKNNKLHFDDIEINATWIGVQGFNFVFAPQDSVGMGGIIQGGVGHEFNFKVNVGGSQNSYQWYKDGTAIQGATDTCLVLNDVQVEDTGWYYCEVTHLGVNPSLSPLLTIYSHQKKLEVTWCTDALGGQYPCDEMIVQFDPTTTPAQRAAVRAQFGIESVDSCMCGIIEMWDMIDTLTLEGSDGTVVAARMKTEVEDAGLNYAMSLPFLTTGGLTIPNDPIQGNTSTDTAKVTVAIIDSGIDFDHPLLKDYIWINSGDPLSTFGDNDGNCLLNDYMGWDFYEDNHIPYDLNGHGTFIAGMIVNALSGGSLSPNQVELMNLKFTNKEGQGSLFWAACAVYYAKEKEADIINASWGYKGLPSSILERAMEDTGINCGALIITSAGNAGTDNDNPTTPHFPSSFQLDNIIAVANDSTGTGILHPTSNFGQSSVDLSASGTAVQSTRICNSTVGPCTPHAMGSGTSMAAAKVTNAAVQLLYEQPNASFRGLKHCLLEEVSVHPSLAGKILTSGLLQLTGSLTCINSPSNTYVTECGLLLKIKLFMEGPFIPGTTFMRDSLRAKNLIPMNQPYNIPPWNLPIAATLTTSTIAITGNNAIVDWVLVRYTDPLHPGTQSGIPCLLQRDGDVVGLDGGPINLGNIVKNGYISISHRNHFGVVTAKPEAISYHPMTFDFTNGSIPLIGPMVTIGPINMMMGGDANVDMSIDTTDIIDCFVPQNGSAPSYLNTADFDLNGTVNALDKIKIWQGNSGQISICTQCY